MSAYALVELEITDPAKMGPYLERVADTVAAHGGKYLVRAGTTEVVEGGIGEYPSKVILEFPNMTAAKAWYASPEYQAILSYRLDNSSGNFIFVEGV